MAHTNRAGIYNAMPRFRLTVALAISALWICRPDLELDLEEGMDRGFDFTDQSFT